MIEIWLPVPYKPFDETYLISSYGNVKPLKKSKYSHTKGEFLKPGYGARGYGCVLLYNGKLKKQCFVHRMVALAFIGNPPVGKTIVCHLDDNKKNNRADNLVWGDPADNMRHMVEHRRSLVGSKNPRALLDDEKVRSIRERYATGKYSQTALGAEYGLTQDVIYKVVKRITWKHL